MKLVVIPGLNGNDQLCQDFLASLNIDVLFIPLPENCAQDHQTLAANIAPQLPDESFILLVESYAGSIAPYLNVMPDIPLKGIIFFVSLLATPSKALLELPKLIRAETLMKLPFAEQQLKSKYLNNDATPEQVKHVRKVVENIPHSILQERAEALKHLGSFPKQPETTVAFVEATHDKVLNQRAKDSIAKVYPGARKYSMEGSHFLLYTKPKQSAALVDTIINKMTH
ncbi:hypothetical protein [Kangiella geojedonensis]|uniref:Alpha/beta hydrolase n=1 Tax=Kangiella geojedonensis TaxID=914150 RepID=A0A0F6TPD3_9GAMM|nr:hypothetical protein [Kangiella geojedonensis]AKE51160.1 hypothetical protein TQ33_0168 [Kangiella geojedonensis]